MYCTVLEESEVTIADSDYSDKTNESEVMKPNLSSNEVCNASYFYNNYMLNILN